MVSTLQLREKYNKIRKNFCFYLDIPDSGLSRSVSQRLLDMGLREELCLSSRVTHVVGAEPARARCARRDASRARADAMLERLRTPLPHPQPHHPQAYVHLTVQKAISLLDKLYDTFFTAPRKAHVNLFSKHYIKIEFLDKPCRPVYKEFDEWPQISLEPDPPKEKKEKIDSTDNQVDTTVPNKNTGQKMTRRNRPRIKEKEEKEQKGGYCEMCNTDYTDAALHRRSPHHLAFVRDHTNFLALDSLIAAGADVTTFLDKAAPLNGERRSLRRHCNGDAEPAARRSKRSRSPDSTVNGDDSPRHNGVVDDRKRSTRCAKKSSESQTSEDRQYYKVVGVSTKLRSSGGFSTRRKDSLPTCNGTKPLVVKFRKVRRSELSVLSDEAEQFMFPKRASSTSSTSSDEDEKDEPPKRRTPPQPPPPVTLERQRLARPLALKEESSEEDSWPEDTRRRKRRAPVAARRGRRVPVRGSAAAEPRPKTPEPKEPTPEPAPETEAEISPIKDETIEKCMKWEDGRLKYTPAVEQLEFAFESVPHSEPWFETFKRQDQDKVVTKNVPKFFALYAKSPKLPYEIGQLPPLKPNCCPLSDLVRRGEKPGPSRSYGTRGMKKQRIRKRTATVVALEGHPRKSPREHASTLAILGSAGLLHRPKNAEDAKSTASEDTISDTQSHLKVEPILSETQEASERLQQFLSEVFEDAAEFDMSDDLMEGETAVIPSTNLPDVSSLVSECEDCDIIRNEINQDVARKKGRRGRFKKKNRTGWPNKKKQKKDSRASSVDLDRKADSSLDRSSAEPPDDTASEDDANISEAEKDEKEESQDSANNTITVENAEELSLSKCEPMDVETESRPVLRSESKPVHFDLKVVLHDNVSEKLTGKKDARSDKRASCSSTSDTEEKEEKVRKKRSLQALGDWLQPVVRVARVDTSVTRRLRSSGRTRNCRFR